MTAHPGTLLPASRFEGNNAKRKTTIEGDNAKRKTTIESDVVARRSRP